jgi:hypothetical protein
MVNIRVFLSVELAPLSGNSMFIFTAAFLRVGCDFHISILRLLVSWIDWQDYDTGKPMGLEACSGFVIDHS